MRYSYYDLGHQSQGNTVVARLDGAAANVLLLDPRNFARYRAADAFSYRGGHFRRSPAEIEIPADGQWYLVIDLGGFKGRVRGTVEVRTPEGVRTHKAGERRLVEA